MKKQYTGPIVKFHSVRCGDQERVRARRGGGVEISNLGGERREGES